MSELQNVEELSKQLGETVTELRATTERLEKKHDALDVDTINKLEGKVGGLSQQISDLSIIKGNQEKAANELEEVKEHMAVLAASGVMEKACQRSLSAACRVHNGTEEDHPRCD